MEQDASEASPFAKVLEHRTASGIFNPATTPCASRFIEVILNYETTSHIRSRMLWGVEETFRKLTGVLTTAVGYMGGKTKNLTCEQVCSDESGHVEVVHIEYEDSHTTYEKLLDVFWANHNPTTPNRQGLDEGSPYRSVIFYYTPEQKKIAEASKAKLGKSGKWKPPIVTQIVPVGKSYRAEEYRQRYLHKRGANSCHL